MTGKPGPFSFLLKHIELQSAKGIPQYKNQDITMKGEFEYTVDRCKYGEKYWINCTSFSKKFIELVYFSVNACSFHELKLVFSLSFFFFFLLTL